MMCLLDMQDGEVDGWMIGTDTFDLRHQVQAAIGGSGDPDGRLSLLAAALYGIDFPPPGKHRLPTGHWLLVS